jgi:putative DNA primase/helicase
METKGPPGSDPSTESIILNVTPPAKIAKPSAIALDKIPAELKALPQWVGVKLRWNTERSKWDKLPIRPDGTAASHSNPDTWSSFEEVVAALNHTDGLGFVFSGFDPYCGIDLDACRDPENGHLTTLVEEVIGHLDSYTEISASGTGLHVICKARLPGGGRKAPKLGLEVYDKLRYFMITGDAYYKNYPINDRQAVVDELLAELFPEKPTTSPPFVASEKTPSDPKDDEDLLKKAFSSKDGVRFQLLWGGNWQEAGYPSQSEADLALTSCLSFWTGRDAARMDALFQQSGLMRPKWGEIHSGTGETYGQSTIAAACANGSTYKPGKTTPSVASTTTALPVPLPPELGEPTIERRPLGYRFTWPGGVEIAASRIRSHSDRTTAELIFTVAGKTLHRANVNLLATATVKGLCRHLAERCLEHPWAGMVDQVIEAVLEGERQGEPVVTFSERPEAPPPQYLLGLLPLESPTVIFADGGTGKSYFASALASIAAAGWTGNPLQLPVKKPHTVLTLDWETNESTADWRLRRLNRGMGYPISSRLKYRRCAMSLADDIEAVCEIVSREQVDLVIIDSLAPASGGDVNTAETALRFFNAVRTLRGVTSLCLAHVSKSETGKKTIFGSAFFFNMARACYELRKQQAVGDDHLDLALFCTKMNDGPMLPPIGLTLIFNGNEVTLTRSSEPPRTNDFTVSGGPSQPIQIIALLKAEGPMSTAGIADTLELGENVVRSLCSRLRKDEKIIQVPVSGQMLWALGDGFTG